MCVRKRAKRIIREIETNRREDAMFSSEAIEQRISVACTIYRAFPLRDSIIHGILEIGHALLHISSTPFIPTVCPHAERT